jgi:hypothetical protein
VSFHGETPERVLAAVRPGRDYVALQAYVDRSPANEETLLQLRRDLRNRTRCATTVGFGPRFLHSTGQLHKGGPKEGVFLQFVDPGDGDVPIPDSAYGFATFLEAQAIGDEKALRSRGLPFAGATASGPSAAALSAWADRVRAAVEERP